MGNCVGGFKQRTRNIVWSNRKNSKSLVIAFLGLENAGKTTILKALQGEGAESVHPTMGFSRGEFVVNKCRIVAYDLGGAERIRDIWKNYFAEIYAIVYVVDSAAASQVDENKKVVDSLREHPDLMSKPILFLLNKKDLPEAMDEMTFSEQFSLHTMACDNKTDIRVEGICAVKGYGKEIDPMIVEGINWLIERIYARYDQLHKEIETALKHLKERQARERLERQHRLATLANRTSQDDLNEVVEMEELGQNTLIPTTDHEVDASTIVPLSNGVVQTGSGVYEHKEAMKQLDELPVELVELKDIESRVPSPTVEEVLEPENEPTSSTVTIAVRPKSAAPIVSKRRASNRIAPEATVEEPVRSRNSRVDYRIFETDDDGPTQAKRRIHSSPLRSKSFDSKILFHRARRPQLLMSHDTGGPNSDLESGSPQPIHSLNHVEFEGQANLEENWTN
ncbi:hypothetical protein M3Y95_00960100 [Aphelenchoides besseyi]|nr:hypothetical protein M3Y95_00960100 [Aphelenchoides besseyi]